MENPDPLGRDFLLSEMCNLYLIQVDFKTVCKEHRILGMFFVLS